MRLEVGILNKEGEALYRSADYVEREAFGGYHASPISRFMQKAL